MLKRIKAVVLVSSMLPVILSHAQAADLSGEALYNHYCATCHAAPTDQRTPPRDALADYNANSIVHALTEGIMQPQGEVLDAQQKVLVAEFLSGDTFDPTLSGNLPACSAQAAPIDLSLPSNWNGWGNGLDNQRYQSAQGTNITLDNVDQLELAWAFGVENATAVRSQPTILGKMMLMGSPSGMIYAFDIDTGCTFWTYAAMTEVRTSLTVAWSEELERHLAVFGDMNNRIYVLNAQTGEKLWHADVDDNRYARSTGSPVIYGDKVFVPVSSTEVSAAGNPDHACCTFRGNVAAYNLNSGEKLWHTYIMEEAKQVGTNSAGNPVLAPSGAPIWGTLTIDPKRNRVYAGSGQNYSRPTSDTSDSVIAFNMDTGHMDWVFQSTARDAFTLACTRGDHPNCPQPGPDIDIGAPILNVTLSTGQEILIAGTKGAMVYALNPDNKGEVLWETRVGRGSPLGGIHWGMTFVGDMLYVPVADGGPLGGEGNQRQPGLHAIDMKTGEVVWYQPPLPRCPEGMRCSDIYSAPATSSDEYVISGALNGTLFVHNRKTGEVVWEYNSLQTYATINGVEAKGGSFDATGPVLSGDYMVVSSGYATFGQIPGNAVLVFRLGGADQ